MVRKIEGSKNRDSTVLGLGLGANLKFQPFHYLFRGKTAALFCFLYCLCFSCSYFFAMATSTDDAARLLTFALSITDLTGVIEDYIEDSCAHYPEEDDYMKGRLLGRAHVVYKV